MSIRKFLLIVALTACAAPSGVGRAQQSAPAQAHSVPYKNPTTATIIGVLVPGGGQLYAERYGKGGALLGGAAVAVGIAIDASHRKCAEGRTCGIPPAQTGGIIVAALLWGYGWATAAHDARLFNTERLTGRAVAPFLDQRNGRLVAGLTLPSP